MCADVDFSDDNYEPDPSSIHTKCFTHSETKSLHLNNNKQTSFQANRFQDNKLHRVGWFSSLRPIFIMEESESSNQQNKMPKRIINYCENRRAFGLSVHFEWLFSIKMSKPQSSLSPCCWLMHAFGLIFSCVSDSRKVHALNIVLSIIPSWLLYSDVIFFKAKTLSAGCIFEFFHILSKQAVAVHWKWQEQNNRMNYWAVQQKLWPSEFMLSRRKDFFRPSKQN